MMSNSQKFGAIRESQEQARKGEKGKGYLPHPYLVK
jgi:hypothetical protein